MSFDKRLTKSAQTSADADNAAKKVLKFFAYTWLVFGILASLIIGGILAGARTNSFWDPDLNLGVFLGVFLGGLFLSFLSWVFVDMSNNLRQIKDELKKLEKPNNE